MINLIRSWLYEPKVRGINVDDANLLGIHSSVLQNKRLLRSAFETFYEEMSTLSNRYFKVEGLEVEMGTGAGFFQSLRPSIITSDIRRGPNIDMELDAQDMDLEADSVRCLYAINVFHHLPNPNKFFNELIRVLQKGGGCVLIEPHIGFCSALLHKHLHSDEHFDPGAPGWETANMGGPLSGANQALADIVFRRDKDIFNSQYGESLEIVHQGYALNAFRYLLSGGLNFRQLAPSFLEFPLKKIESFLRPIAKYWSLHQVIVIRKKW